MMVRRFIIAQRVYTKRPNVVDGGESVSSFVPRPEWGKFDTREEAKRWYVSNSDPDPVFKSCDDAWIARHFKTMCRNHGVRLVREVASC